MTTNCVPTASDWSFDDIERYQPERAALLEAAGSANELLRRLTVTLRIAVAEDKLRFGVDFDGDNPRSIIQFPAEQHTYDWFFSARTGYRAQFWAGRNKAMNTIGGSWQNY